MNDLNDSHLKLRASNVLAASQYGASGSSTRVRIYDWLKHLEISEFSRYEYRSTSSNSPIALLKDLPRTVCAERARQKLPKKATDSIVILSRELSPLSRGSTEARLLRSAAHGIYDFDDALYARLPGTIGHLYSRAKVWSSAVTSADTVIAGSEILAEHARTRNPNVVVIPSCVEHTEYSAKTNFEFGAQPLAVWIGSPSTEPYLQIAATSLIKANQEYGLRLRVISSGAQSLGELDSMVDRVDWSADSFTQALSSADFGIMPLPDNEWARGKCAYKLLQYGAAGIPVIGSPIGANVDALHKLNGFLAANDDDWLDSISDLIQSNVEERTVIGRSARDGVIKHFSFMAWRDTWLNAVVR